MLLTLQNASHDRNVPGLTNAHSWLCTPCPIPRTWIDLLLKNDLTAFFLYSELLLVALWHRLRDLPNPEMPSLPEHLSSLIYRFRLSFLCLYYESARKENCRNVFHFIAGATAAPMRGIFNNHSLLGNQGCQQIRGRRSISSGWNWRWFLLSMKINNFPFSGAEG
jgi:hypothetical protein